MRIVRAVPGDAAVVAFLQAHLDDIAPTAPLESQHALGIAALQDPAIQLWVARGDDDAVVGTVALAELSVGHEELKSMRTVPALRGMGIGSQLLAFALRDARSRGITRVSLETGSMGFFEPARALYRKAGFIDCPPFGRYVADPNSVFMTTLLSDTPPH